MIREVFVFVLYVVYVKSEVNSKLQMMQPPSCIEMNYDVDELVTASNYMVNYVNGMLLNANGFQQNLTVNLLGLSAPVSLSVKVPQGTMTSFNNLTRIGDVTYCSTANLQTLEGVFRFRDVRLDYDGVEVTLGSWSVKGPLSYTLQPEVHVILTKGNVDCRLKSLEVVSSGAINYDLTVDASTWRNWLISKAIGRVELDADSIVKIAVLPNIQFCVESTMKTIWCDSSDLTPK
uniref:Anucleate primary sterigmata protein B n=1 Tax=Lygus hesperus TaxID=30085 RepID=A0A0A9YJ86_LYGHE